MSNKNWLYGANHSERLDIRENCRPFERVRERLI
jgi:hypothetical protein